MTDIVAGTDNRYEEWCRDCAIVTRGLDLACKKFFEIGAALARIRDSKSYLSVRGYNTFEDCCDKQFGISRGHAYRLIDAAAVYADLAPPRGDKALQLSLSPPISEAQCRPLVRLTSEQRKAVWKKVIAENPGGPPTAQKLTAAVGAVTGAPPAAPRQQSRPHDPDIAHPRPVEVFRVPQDPDAGAPQQIEVVPASANPDVDLPQKTEVVQHIPEVSEPPRQIGVVPAPSPDVTNVLDAVARLTKNDKFDVLARSLKFMSPAPVYNILMDHLQKQKYVNADARVRFLGQVTETLNEDAKLILVQKLLVNMSESRLAELVLRLLERVPADYIVQVEARLRQLLGAVPVSN